MSRSDLADLLGPLAGCLTAVSLALQQFFAEPGSRDAHASIIEERRREAKTLARGLEIQLDPAFLMWCDRRDLRRIATGLHGVLSGLADTARRAVTVRLTGLPRPMAELLDIVARSAAELETAVSVVGHRKLLRHCDELRRLVEEGAVASDEGLTHLFVGRPDVVDLLKWKDTYEGLHTALNRIERVARLLEATVL